MTTRTKLNAQGKRDVHLTVNPESHRRAKMKAAELELDLSRATELLWELWFSGKVKIDNN